MSLISMIIVFYVLIKMISGHESLGQRIDKMDNEVGFTKSDKWYNSHPGVTKSNLHDYYKKGGK